jgi:mRNA interferase MazF
MLRGEIYWVDLGDGQGSEQKGMRPAIIVSNDSINRNSTVVTVIPCTSKSKGNYAYHLQLSLYSGKVSTLLAEQIRTIDKQRVKQKIGSLSADKMVYVNRIIRIAMGME